MGSTIGALSGSAQHAGSLTQTLWARADYSAGHLRCGLWSALHRPASRQRSCWRAKAERGAAGGPPAEAAGCAAPFRPGATLYVGRPGGWAGAAAFIAVVPHLGHAGAAATPLIPAAWCGSGATGRGRDQALARSWRWEQERQHTFPASARSWNLLRWLIRPAGICRPAIGRCRPATLGPGPVIGSLRPGNCQRCW